MTELLPTPGEQLVRDMAKAKLAAGASWDRAAMMVFCDEWLARFAASRKRVPRRKEPLSEHAGQIYHAYPRKVAPAAAMKAISTILRDGRATKEHLLAQTELYARCVTNWPRSFRYSDGRDTVPHPATFFTRGSWADDPKEWYGPKGEPVEQVRQVDTVYPEPDGWTDEFPDSVHKTWDDMPQANKAHICTVMSLARKLAVPAEPASIPSLLFPPA